MSDLSIRRLTIAEEAKAAAARFVATGEAEPNPYTDEDQKQAWRSAFDRWVLALSAAQDTEAGA